MKIVITGSLGNISGPLTAMLVKGGHTVTVISRSADKQKQIEQLGASAAIGSLGDEDFLAAVFAGADAVYCMLPPFNYFDPGLNYMQAAGTLADCYVKAINTSGVKHVVHLSSVGADMDKGNGLLAFHHLAEQKLRQLPAAVTLTHIRPVAFYNNLFDFIDMVKGEGFLAGFVGKLLVLQHYGVSGLLKGYKGFILSNYGAEDKIAWVSPEDIALAVAEELVSESKERKVRYVASEELTCNEVAGILGTAVGKPYLKWVRIADKQLLSATKKMNAAPGLAEGLVEMNHAMHTGLVFEDYYRNRPVLGKVKMKDFAKQFAQVYHQK